MDPQQGLQLMLLAVTLADLISNGSIMVVIASCRSLKIFFVFFQIVPAGLAMVRDDVEISCK